LGQRFAHSIASGSDAQFHSQNPETVHAYWTRQWGLIDPQVEPLGFEEQEADCVLVKVHEVVRDLQGAVLADRVICHVYAFEGDLVRRMEIREP
jgi:hypothetical protein